MWIFLLFIIDKYRDLKCDNIFVNRIKKVVKNSKSIWWFLFASLCLATECAGVEFLNSKSIFCELFFSFLFFSFVVLVVGTTSFASHSRYAAEATNMNLLHSWEITSNLEFKRTLVQWNSKPKLENTFNLHPNSTWCSRCVVSQSVYMYLFKEE